MDRSSNVHCSTVRKRLPHVHEDSFFFNLSKYIFLTSPLAGQETTMLRKNEKKRKCIIMKYLLVSELELWWTYFETQTKLVDVDVSD